MFPNGFVCVHMEHILKQVLVSCSCAVSCWFLLLLETLPDHLRTSNTFWPEGNWQELNMLWSYSTKFHDSSALTQKQYWLAFRKRQRLTRPSFSCGDASLSQETLLPLKRSRTQTLHKHQPSAGQMPGTPSWNQEGLLWLALGSQQMIGSG